VHRVAFAMAFSATVQHLQLVPLKHCKRQTALRCDVEHSKLQTRRYDNRMSDGYVCVTSELLVLR
jgi:hypothetical protein